MRRLLNDVASYLAELAGAARGGWNAFFFSPADPTGAGLIRVAAGLLAFWSLLVFGLDLHDYFGSDGWADPAAIRTLERPLAWSFWFLVPDRLAPAGLVRLPGGPGAVYRWAVQPGDGRAELGDRGLDRAAGADRAVRV